MINERVNFFTAFRRVKGFRAALNRITHAIRFRAPTPLPKGMEGKPATVLCPREYRFRHYCKSATHAGKPAVLGKAAQFNRALPCFGNFEYGMRNIWIGNIGFVRGIEEKQRLVPARVIDPPRELFSRCNGSGWVIRKTEINKIGVFSRWIGDKSILSCARQIQNSFVAPIFSCRPTAARHHVRIDVDRIYRIGDRDSVLIAENVEDVTAIAF